MKRLVKQGNDIVNDVWATVKKATTIPVYKYAAPLVKGGLPTTEYIVVTLLSADAEQAYNALVIVNIYAPNIAEVYPNETRFVAIAAELLEYMDYYSGLDFLLTTDVAGRMNRNADGTFFYTTRFFYETIIKEI